MANKTFTYGGYTFEPRGTFKDFGIKPGKQQFVKISRALHLANWELRFCVADGDEHFDYDKFYEASGGKDADVFYCKETGELYVPCAGTLQVFDQKSTSEEVRECYRRRKQERLQNVMCFTEEQHQAFNALMDAIVRCKQLGIDYAVNDSDVYAFRADLLEDLTSDMAPRKGQESIENGLCCIVEGAWDANDGLYANVKDLPHLK